MTTSPLTAGEAERIYDRATLLVSGDDEAHALGLLAVAREATARERAAVVDLLLSEKGRFTVVDALEQTDADGADCIGVTEALVRIITARNATSDTSGGGA